MKNIELKDYTFSHFIESFPELELPVTLTEESQIHFSRANQPLPQAAIANFLFDLEEGQVDEFTEFIPCFRVPNTQDFQAIVYWRAGLMDYEYTMATFLNNGELISKRVIAGTKYKDGRLIRSVATIQDDGLIYIVVGYTNSEDNELSTENSRSLNMELLDTGEIVDV